MIKRGATTMWESWHGVDDDGVAHDSLNHYSKGAVIGFLHRYTAGLRPGVAPGYRDFRIEPVPGGGLAAASAAHESPYGRIESAWTLEGGRLRLTAVVPPGTTAEVRLPGAGRSAPPPAGTRSRHHGRSAQAEPPPLLQHRQGQPRGGGPLEVRQPPPKDATRW